MRIDTATIAAIASLALPGPAFPQSANQRTPTAERFIDTTGGVTLEAAVAQALQREPSLRAARAEEEVARGRRHQAQLRPNPTASIGYQKEPAGTDHQARIEVEWPLDLFRKAGRVAVADRELKATRQAIADRERLLAAEVRRKYGEVLTAVRDVGVGEDLVAATARQHDLVSARADLGATPPLERNMLRVELQRLESERFLAAGRAEQALIELKRLLGEPADSPLKLHETLEQLVHRETAAALPGVEPKVAERPDVQEADARVQVAVAEIDRSRSEGRVDVSLFGMYMRMDSGFPQRGFTGDGELERVRGVFNYVAGGAMLTLPFRNRNQGEVAAARARRTGAEAQLEAVRLSAHSEIAAARARDEAARQALLVYTADARALARQNLEVVGQTYELGRMTLFDVLAEQRRYLDLERAYTTTLGEAYDARQALRLALGEVR